MTAFRCLDCGAAALEDTDPLHACELCGLEQVVLPTHHGMFRVRGEGLPVGAALTDELNRLGDLAEARA